MISFVYEMKDELGLHARPAGMLTKEAMHWKSTITLECGGKKADARRLMALMSMGIKQGQTVTVTIEGEDETSCGEAVKAFMEANL